MWKKTRLVKPADQLCFRKTTTLPIGYPIDHSRWWIVWHLYYLKYPVSAVNLSTWSYVRAWYHQRPITWKSSINSVPNLCEQNANTLPTIATFLQMWACIVREWLDFNFEPLQSGRGVFFPLLCSFFLLLIVLKSRRLFCRLSQSWFNAEMRKPIMVICELSFNQLIDK